MFLDVGVKLGVPAAPLAFQLLFATNYFSAITPQGSSANLLFAGSGFLSQRDLYRLGGFVTAFNMSCFCRRIRGRALVAGSSIAGDDSKRGSS